MPMGALQSMKMCYNVQRTADTEVVFPWCHEPDHETDRDTCRHR